MTQLRRLRNMKRFPVALLGFLAVSASVATAQQITAAGATFPAPIYQKWFGEYHKLIRMCRSTISPSVQARVSSSSLQEPSISARPTCP